jgi:DNA-binding transcriptional MerR regulator
MSKPTQISLDFGPEENQPSASTGDSDAGNDPTRHYVAAGGVGIRVKSYKQTPAAGGSNLFGDVAATPGQPAKPILPGAAKTSDTNGLPAAEPLVEKQTLVEKQRLVEEEFATEGPKPAEDPPIAVQEAVAAAEPVQQQGPIARQEPMVVSTAKGSSETQAAPASEDGPLPKRQSSTKAAAAQQKNTYPQMPSKRGRKSLKQVSSEADLIEIPADEVLFSKQYYTMGEVAEMFRVNQSLLRFWESEFDVLQPRKNKKGDRYFRPVDIKNLHLIYHLLRQKKYTIEGAKDFLKKNKKADERFEVVKRLQEIKAFLLEMKAQL